MRVNVLGVNFLGFVGFSFWMGLIEGIRMGGGEGCWKRWDEVVLF